MDSPVVAVIRALQRSSRHLFPNGPSLKYTSIYWLQAFANFGRVRGMVGTSTDTALAKAMKSDPEFFGVLIWPLLDARWDAGRRLQALQDHYQEAQNLGPLFDLDTDSTRTLLGFDGDLAPMRICIEKQTFFRREGQLVISVFYGDGRVYSVAFLLARINGARVAYVGAVQGVKQPDDSTLYKDMTKDCFGLRPRDLSISMFLILCQALDVQRIFAVQDAFRSHRHSYFGADGGSKVQANYDEIWTEREATLTPEGFYELAVGSEVKDLQSVPSKKRSMYRKRYQLLTDTLAALRTTLQTGQAGLVVTPGQSEPTAA